MSRFSTCCASGRARTAWTWSTSVSLALFFALSGTAVAGARAFVTGDVVKDHSLTGADIQEGLLDAVSLSLAARRQLRGADGKDGREGAAGALGAKG